MDNGDQANWQTCRDQGDELHVKSVPVTVVDIMADMALVRDEYGQEFFVHEDQLAPRS